MYILYTTLCSFHAFLRYKYQSSRKSSSRRSPPYQEQDTQAPCWQVGSLINPQSRYWFLWRRVWGWPPERNSAAMGRILAQQQCCVRHGRLFSCSEAAASLISQVFAKEKKRFWTFLHATLRRRNKACDLK